MANPLDLVLDNRISILESLCARYRQGTCLAYGKFTPLQRMSNNAQSFWALKETKSPCGRSYANRVSKLQHEGRSFLHNYDLKALEDFASRQKQVACEAELELFQGSLRALEKQDEEQFDALKEPSQSPGAVNPEPTSLLPSSVEVLSINTSARMLVAKDPHLPFILKFSPRTQRYQLIERYCGHLECRIEENLSHYYLNPAETAYLAWAPGMLHVHTETLDYVKDEQGDYCNIGLPNVEELEILVEGMKAKGVHVEKVTISVLGYMLSHG